MCRVISLALPLGLLVLLVKWITHKRIESEIHNFKIKMESIPVFAEEEEDEVEPMIMVGLPRVRVVRSLKGEEIGDEIGNENGDELITVGNLCCLVESVENYTNFGEK